MPGPDSRPGPKPEPRRKGKARAKRLEAAVVQDVRARCVERDGYCRIHQATHHGLDYCYGPSEWAHMHDKRRSKTVGQAPVVRHTTQGSFMACQKHHGQYDRHEIQVEAITQHGADGTLRIARACCSILSLPRG